LAAIHHLVVDGVSWRILFEDIETLYRHAPLPPKSDSFKGWGEELRKYANSEEFLAEKNYWARLESMPVEPIERDFAEENTFIKDLETLAFNLSEAETAALFTKVGTVFAAETQDILVICLAAAFKKARAVEHLLVALEGHGREEIIKDSDIGRTVGWFTAIYPVVVDVSGEKEWSARVQEITGMLRRVPHKGTGYGILKYLTAQELKKGIAFKLKPQVGFNYLGRFDTDMDRMSFVMAGEPVGQTHSPRGIRKYDFTVTGIAAGRRLGLSIAYSKKQYKRETAAAILRYWREGLQAILQ
jgi:non-ribosomal peptide synthase protein (TIGR01720 family)